MPYLLLLPVVICFTAALGIILLHWLRPGFGYAWLLAVVSSLAGWAVVLWFHFSPPPAVIFINWLPLNSVAGTLLFQFDPPAWVYTFNLAALAAAVILTAAARLQYHSNPATWAASLAIAGAGMLAALAGTPLTLIMAWTLIDVLELVFILNAVQGAELNREAVTAFSMRVAGTLTVMGAMVFSKVRGQELTLIAPLPEVSIFLLIAAALRLGVLPLHLPYLREASFRRGVSTMLRMTAAASSLVVLGRLPPTVVPADWFPWLLAAAGATSFYGAVMWLLAVDEIRGRPYWLISLAGMAVSCAIRGYPDASLAWGTALMLSGGELFLYSARERRILFLPGLSLLAMSGLPFTPAAAGWAGLVVPPLNFPDFAFLLAQALLMLGFLRHTFRPEESMAAMERWIKGVYPFGLVLLVVSAGLVGVFGWPGSLSAGVWWASLLAALLAMAGGWGTVRLLAWWRHNPERTGWLVALAQPAGRVFNGLFRLDWFYRLGNWGYRGIQRVIESLTIILEGEGGILWVLVLLALLISVLHSSGVQLP